MNLRKLKRGMLYLKDNGIKKSIKKLILRAQIKKSMKNVSLKYEDYILNNEPKDSELESQRKFNFNLNPKISFVIPMYNTKYEFFKELMDSILSQTYGNYEICLTDSSEVQNHEIKEYIKINNTENKIKYLKLSNNQGISENTNKAIEMATGEYIAFCDHDDIVAPNALFEVVRSINDGADFIYSDEDILKDGKRINPHFKPDFSPDLLTSYNYICHLVVVSRNLLNKVGMLNGKFDGAQDYEFCLRATEKAKKIRHIPKVLYHWRSHDLSTAGNSESKKYVFEAGKMAIKEHFDRLKIPVEVEILEEPGRYRVKYELISNPKVSIIIPNKDAKKDLAKCIESILKSTYENYEIVIVENNSKSKEIFDYYEQIKKISEKIKVVNINIDKFNYSKINNFGIDNSDGEYIILLNNDTKILSNDWIENMLGICKRDDVGVVGAKLIYPDGTLQHAGVVVGIGGIAGHVNVNIPKDAPGYFSRAQVINNFSAVTAACLMIKRNVFYDVGKLDENLEVAFNDIDLCLKVRAKSLLVVYTPYAVLNHYESKTRGKEDTKEKIKRFENEIDIFKKKWGNVIEKGDPYYNPNLRIDKVNFEINTQKIKI